MPTYEYRCNACDHQFEEFQSITAKALRKCPECAKPKLERLIGTGAGIIFKGSGFYETDYRSDSYKKGAEAEKSNGKAEKSDKSDKGDAGGGGGDSASKKDKAEKKSEKTTTAKSDTSGGGKKSCGPGCGCGC